MYDELDLVDEMEWEDHVEFLTLEEAGLENPPDFDTIPGSSREYYGDEDILNFN